MNFEESYQKYIILAEENGTTNSLSTDKGRFAVKFNIAQNKVIEWLIESNATDENRYLQKIKVPFEKLSESKKEDHFTSFSLPKNYFDFIDLRVSATKGNCKQQVLKSTEVKAENLNFYLTDTNLDPSFKYRETIYTILQDSIQVYKKDFEIDQANLVYYRYPKQIELQDPDQPESPFKDEQVEFDDKLTNRIIFMTVALHDLSSDDPKYQAFKQETIQKF